MTAPLIIFALWLLFAGSHIGLAVAAVRQPLVARLGKRGFMWLYNAVASAGFIALVVGYAELHDAGPAGIGLAATPAVRWALVVAAVGGVMLMTAAFAPRGYWDSPAAVLQDHVRGPVGLERITRHPFFSGLVMVMGAHVLLTTRASGVVFFAGFAVLSIGGSLHQARKLRAERGPAYDGYLAQTSAIPFAAIAGGRQRLVLGELPWPYLLLGGAAAYGVHAAHANLLAWHGAPIWIVGAGAGWVIGLIQSLRAAR